MSGPKASTSARASPDVARATGDSNPEVSLQAHATLSDRCSKAPGSSPNYIIQLRREGSKFAALHMSAPGTGLPNGEVRIYGES